MQNEKCKTTTKNSKIDLKIRTYYFALEIIELVDGFPNRRIYWIIGDQLLRCSTSIGANIIEAQAASSKKDFINFFNHSLKSANETKFWLGLLRDSGKADKDVINGLIKEAEEISNILAASILTAKGRRKF